MTDRVHDKYTSCRRMGRKLWKKLNDSEKQTMAIQHISSIVTWKAAFLLNEMWNL